MSEKVDFQRRLVQLRKLQADIPAVLERTAREATKAAVQAAADATPPKAGSGRLAGTNMLTGELKAHWASDSITEPIVAGKKYITQLNNNMEYASYVNDGHRMDEHFVPGLYVDENGQLNRDPARKVGLMVGTKTSYVNGEFMTDKGEEAYQETVKAILDAEIKRLIK